MADQANEFIPVIKRNVSIQDFKAEFSSSNIDLIRNPKTNKTFFVCGSITGAISKKWTKDNPSEFILMELEGGELLWCLHNKNMSNVFDTL